MLLEQLRHGGMAYMAGVLQWMNTGSSGKTGRKDEGQWVALYLKNQVKCTELLYGMDDRQVESFLVRIRQEASSGDSVVGICYRPPNQYEELLSKVPRAIRISFTQASFVSNIFQPWGRTWQYRLLPISDTSAAHKQNFSPQFQFVRKGEPVVSTQIHSLLEYLFFFPVEIRDYSIDAYLELGSVLGPTLYTQFGERTFPFIT